jgi:hypothetical protein
MRIVAALLASCLASTLAGGDAQATTLSAAMGISNLTRAQEERFERIVCRPHHVGLYAAEGTGFATGNDFRMTNVNLRCDPHREIAHQPVAYEIYCRREVSEKWECAHAEEKMFVRLGDTTYNIGANHNAVPVEEAYRIFRFLISIGELQHAPQSKPFGHREDREVTFAVWKDEGDKIFAHCHQYMVITRLGPGEYRLEPHGTAALVP